MPDTFGQLIFESLVDEFRLEYVLDLMCTYLPGGIRKFGDSEPLKESFDSKNLRRMANRFWAIKNTYWTGTDGMGGVFRNQSGRGVQSSVLTIWTDIRHAFGLAGLFSRLSATLMATYGYVHRVVAAEIAFSRESGALLGPVGHYQMSITRAKLLRCLPDCYWFNIFGPPYVALFGGEDRLLRAPVQASLKLASNTFSLQLVPELNDIDSAYAEYAAVKSILKDYLGNDCFFRSGAGQRVNYNVPTFGWLEPPHAILG